MLYFLIFSASKENVTLTLALRVTRPTAAWTELGTSCLFEMRTRPLIQKHTLCMTTRQVQHGISTLLRIFRLSSQQRKCIIALASHLSISVRTSFYLASSIWKWRNMSPGFFEPKCMMITTSIFSLRFSQPLIQFLQQHFSLLNRTETFHFFPTQ